MSSVVRSAGSSKVKVVAVLSSIFLLSGIAMSLPNPFMAIYVEELGADVAIVGAVLSASMLTSAVFQGASGVLSDRLGRKNMHVLGSFMALLPPLMYARSNSWEELVPWAILQGVASGIFMPARWTLVALHVPATAAEKAYRYVNSALIAGWTVGPLLGGVLADSVGVRSTFLAVALFYMLTFILSLKVSEAEKSEEAHTSYKDILPFRLVLISFLLLNLFQGISFGSTTPITPLFVKRRFKAHYSQLGLLFAAGYGIPSIVAQFLGAWASGRVSKFSFILTTILTSSPILSLQPLSPSLHVFVIVMLAWNVILNLGWPPYQALILEVTPRDRLGTINGLTSTAFMLGLGLGSQLGGYMGSAFDLSIPFYFSGIALFLSSLPLVPLLIRMKKSNSAQRHPPKKEPSRSSSEILG